MSLSAQCAICQDVYTSFRDVAALYCGHCYHYACLLQWFETNQKTCPACRTKVDVHRNGYVRSLFFDEADADPDLPGSSQGSPGGTGRSEMERLKKEITEAKGKLHEATSELANLRNQSQASQRQLLTMSNEKTALDRRYQHLKRKLADEQVQQQINMQITEDNGNLRSQLSVVHDRVAELEQRLVRLQSIEAILERSRNAPQEEIPLDVDTLRGQVYVLKKKLESSESGRKRLFDDVKKTQLELSQLRVDMSEKDRVCHSLREELKARSVTTPFDPRLRSLLKPTPVAEDAEQPSRRQTRRQAVNTQSPSVLKQGSSPLKRVEESAPVTSPTKITRHYSDTGDTDVLVLETPEREMPARHYAHCSRAAGSLIGRKNLKQYVQTKSIFDEPSGLRPTSSSAMNRKRAPKITQYTAKAPKLSRPTVNQRAGDNDVIMAEEDVIDLT